MADVDVHGHQPWQCICLCHKVTHKQLLIIPIVTASERVCSAVNTRMSQCDKSVRETSS